MPPHCHLQVEKYISLQLPTFDLFYCTAVACSKYILQLGLKSTVVVQNFFFFFLKHKAC